MSNWQARYQTVHENITSMSREFVRKVLDFLAKRRFVFWTRVYHVQHRHRYDAPAHPYKMINVDPSDITCRVRDIPGRSGLGRICVTDWIREPVREEVNYIGMIQRFDEGQDWEETTYYRHAKERFEAGATPAGYETLEQFRAIRCSYLDELFHDIRENGYRPNFEGEHDVPAEDVRQGKARFVSSLEPLVVIGEDGSIYWYAGYHRLAMSQILEINQIPVHVVARHRKWQRVRDALHSTPRTELKPALEAQLEHPDMQDIVAGEQTIAPRP